MLGRIWRTVNRRYIEWRVEHILSDVGHTNTQAAEADFENLQKYPQNLPPYNYDSYSVWERGVDRSRNLIKLLPDREPGIRVLEVGCGDAMVGLNLANYGHQVTVSDIEDWRDPRAKGLDLLLTGLEDGLDVEDASFDLAFSYNTFEHLKDPAACLTELVRIVRPGGLIHLDFGPLYASPWGLHAYRSLRMPYPQFLFSEEFIDEKLSELKLYDLGREQVSLQPLNRWKINQFQVLWSRSGCEVVRYGENRVCGLLDVILKYPKSFVGRGLSMKDLCTGAVRITLRKSEGGD